MSGRFERALLRTALRALPPAFRARFGDAMLESVGDGLSERTGLRRTAFLVRSLVGVVGAGVRERIHPTPVDPPPATADNRVRILDVLLQELRFALRSLRRRPGFSVVAVGMLALGIGANSAIFSVVHGVLLRPLPLPEPERLRMVWKYDLAGEPGRSNMSKPDLEDVGALPSVAGAEGYSETTLTLTGGDAPEQVSAARVTGGLLEVLGVAPHMGRDLRHDESVPDAPRVAVVGYAFWRGRLGGRPDVVGSTLEIAEVSHEVVGVAPEGLDFPGDAQLWVPFTLDPEGCARGCHVLRAVLRMAPGVASERLEAELTALASRLREAYPDSNHRKGFHTESLMDFRVGDVRRGLWLLLGAVGVVLLIACANLANLLLVRGSGRKAEMAVRSALGAGRRRMIVGVLGESAVLAAAGSGLGLLLAAAVIAGFRRVPPGIVPRIDEVALDGTVVAFTAVLAVVVTFLFGSMPALHLAGSSPARELRSGGRGGADRREARSRSLLLVAEIALSVSLLVGAGLFLRSLAELRAVDLGFSERERVTRFTLSLPESRYTTLAQVGDVFRYLEDRLASRPGVEAVGSVFGPPMGANRVTANVRVEGRPEPAPGEETHTSVHPATPGYMETLGIPVREGRGLAATDREDTEGVAVVSESFAAENFPGESALGRRVGVTISFGYETAEWFTVVGVVPDVRRTPTSEPRPGLYVPHAQFGPEYLTVHVRGPARTADVVEDARRIVAELDPNLPLTRVETLEQALDRETATTRFYLRLVGAFAALAVILTAVGLYGVVSYLVTRRTREIGIRVALGAGAGRVRRMVILHGLRPALAGVLVGVVAVLAGGRVMEGLLHGVTPGDSRVLAGAVGLVLVVTVLASMLPAWRATRVDPSRALSAE